MDCGESLTHCDCDSLTRSRTLTHTHAHTDFTLTLKHHHRSKKEITRQKLGPIGPTGPEEGPGWTLVRSISQGAEAAWRG